MWRNNSDVRADIIAVDIEIYSYFEKGCWKKMCTRQSRKVIWDMIDTLFLTTVALSNLLLLLSVSTRKHIFMAFRANSFKFLWRTVNSKPPTMPFGIAACTFSDNLSRNSCILAGRLCRSLRPRTRWDYKLASRELLLLLFSSLLLVIKKFNAR